MNESSLTAVLVTAFLMSVRLGAVFLLAPFFSAAAVSRGVRGALLVVLVILLYPAARTAQPVAITAAAIAGEALVGAVIGVGAALLVAAAELAGDVIAAQSGLAGASSLDPISNASTPTVSQFMNLLVVALLFAANAHVVLLEAVADSLRALPLGTMGNAPDALAHLMAQVPTMFLIGLRLAAPVIAVVMLANVAMGALARAAPQMNVFILVYPVQIALAIGVLALALPFVGLLLAGWPAADAARSISLLQLLRSR
jgi:flagellar biosynthetic protein FliR